MEHFNKNSFIGEQVWSAIKILAGDKIYNNRFEYSCNGKTIYCENYGNNSFGIREITSKPFSYADNKGVQRFVK